jgi:hypothetical protein
VISSPSNCVSHDHDSFRPACRIIPPHNARGASGDRVLGWRGAKLGLASVVLLGLWHRAPGVPLGAASVRVRKVVTSRPAAYSCATVLADFAHAHIDPLEDGAIETFLGHWCSHVWTASPTEALRYRAGLMRALRVPDVLDDWGLAPVQDQERRDLLEILEDRYGAVRFRRGPKVSWNPSASVCTVPRGRRRGPGVGVIFERVTRPRSSTLGEAGAETDTSKVIPTHGYQHDRPSQLQVPSRPVARATTTTNGRGDSPSRSNTFPRVLQSRRREKREFTICCLWRVGSRVDSEGAHNPLYPVQRLARRPGKIERFRPAS